MSQAICRGLSGWMIAAAGGFVFTALTAGWALAQTQPDVAVVSPADDAAAEELAALIARYDAGETELALEIGSQLLDSDGDRAAPYLSRAAGAGDAEARRLLGILFCRQETQAGYDKAWQLFTESAEAGNAKSFNDLGLMLEHGEGREVDFEAAVKQYERGSEAGSGDCTFRLWQLLRDGEYPDQTSTVEKETALLKKAAEQKSDRAMVYLATDEQYWGDADPAVALKARAGYLKQAGELGNETARFTLAFVTDEVTSLIPATERASYRNALLTSKDPDTRASALSSLADIELKFDPALMTDSAIRPLFAKAGERLAQAAALRTNPTRQSTDRLSSAVFYALAGDMRKALRQRALYETASGDGYILKSYGFAQRVESEATIHNVSIDAALPWYALVDDGREWPTARRHLRQVAVNLWSEPNIVNFETFGSLFEEQLADWIKVIEQAAADTPEGSEREEIEELALRSYVWMNEVEKAEVTAKSIGGSYHDAIQRAIDIFKRDERHLELVQMGMAINRTDDDLYAWLRRAIEQSGAEEPIIQKALDRFVENFDGGSPLNDARDSFTGEGTDGEGDFNAFQLVELLCNAGRWKEAIDLCDRTKPPGTRLVASAALFTAAVQADKQDTQVAAAGKMHDAIGAIKDAWTEVTTSRDDLFSEDESVVEAYRQRSEEVGDDMVMGLNLAAKRLANCGDSQALNHMRSATELGEIEWRFEAVFALVEAGELDRAKEALATVMKVLPEDQQQGFTPLEAQCAVARAEIVAGQTDVGIERIVRLFGASDNTRWIVERQLEPAVESLLTGNRLDDILPIIERTLLPEDRADFVTSLELPRRFTAADRTDLATQALAIALKPLEAEAGNRDPTTVIRARLNMASLLLRSGALDRAKEQVILAATLATEQNLQPLMYEVLAWHISTGDLIAARALRDQLKPMPHDAAPPRVLTDAGALDHFLPEEEAAVENQHVADFWTALAEVGAVDAQRELYHSFLEKVTPEEENEFLFQRITYSMGAGMGFSGDDAGAGEMLEKLKHPKARAMFAAGVIEGCFNPNGVKVVD